MSDNELYKLRRGHSEIQSTNKTHYLFFQCILIFIHFFHSDILLFYVNLRNTEPMCQYITKWTKELPCLVNVHISQICPHSLQSPIPKILTGLSGNQLFVHFKVKCAHFTCFKLKWTHFIEINCTFHTFQVEMRTFHSNQL